MGRTSVLIFDDVTGEQIEVDFRGTSEDVLKRLRGVGEGAPGRSGSDNEPRGPGGRSWVSSPARSPCCRGTGTG